MIPTLRTDRLELRPYETADAPVVQFLAGEEAIASTTLMIPHPYPDGAAEAWIATHAPSFEDGTGLVLAITTPSDGLVGTVGLEIEAEHRRAELGYWIGVPFWGRGYATEAAARVVDYGFDELGLNRIEARYLTRNPASARVMRKLGMTFEGILRQQTIKWGVPEDLGVYSILAGER